MAYNQIQIGPQSVVDGTTPTARGGKGGEMIVSDLNPVYYEQAYRKNTFFAAAQAGQTTTVGLNTTYVGLVLSNPLGNAVNLVINKVSIGWTVIAAAVDTIGIAVGYNATTNVTHTVAVTTAPASTLFGVGPLATAKADTSATLPTAPVYYCFLANTPAATTNPPGGVFDLQGSLIIPPGGYVCTVTTAASAAAAFLASFQWSEIAL